jgi:hypothetical protein
VGPFSPEVTKSRDQKMSCPALLFFPILPPPRTFFPYFFSPYFFPVYFSPVLFSLYFSRIIFPYFFSYFFGVFFSLNFIPIFVFFVLFFPYFFSPVFFSPYYFRVLFQKSRLLKSNVRYGKKVRGKKIWEKSTGGRKYGKK